MITSIFTQVDVKMCPHKINLIISKTAALFARDIQAYLYPENDILLFSGVINVLNIDKENMHQDADTQGNDNLCQS